MSESIYNLIPQPMEAPAKGPRYKSKHAPDGPPTFSTFGLTNTSKPGYTNVAGTTVGEEGAHAYKKTHATFGTENNAHPPTEMLRKGAGIGGGAVKGESTAQPSATRTYSNSRKPAVPTAKACMTETSRRGEKETKNFVTSNAVENILSVPNREPEPMDWTQKPSYGKVPPYLRKIKKEIADEYEYIRVMQQQQDATMPEGLRVLGQDERLHLIDELKSKWDEVNKLYQQSSVLSLASLDTIGKVKRKEMYEAQLAQIEKDIEKLSKKIVYVQDD